MRNNRNSSRNLFITATRFGILAMAFALVFALVISGGIFDITASSDNVALASQETMGSTTQLTQYNGVDVTVSSLQLLAQNALKRNSSSFTYSTQLNGVNLEPYTSGRRWCGDSVSLSFFDGGIGAGGFGIKENSKHGIARYPTLYAAVNIAIPQAILDLTKITLPGTSTKMYTVTAVMKTTISSTGGGDELHQISLKANNATVHATSYVISNDKEDSAYTWTGNSMDAGAAEARTSNSVSITGSETNLTLGLKRESGGNCTSDVFAYNTSIEYTISVSANAKYDLSAPQITTFADYAASIGYGSSFVPENSPIKDRVEQQFDTSVNSEDITIPASGYFENSKINLTAYRNSVIASNYYKQLTMNFTEFYSTIENETNEEGTVTGIKVTGTKPVDGSAQFIAGLQTVKINGETVYDYFYQNGSTTITFGGYDENGEEISNVGQVTISIASDRKTLSLAFVFYRNAEFTVAAVDSLGNSVTKTVAIEGIDLTAPTVGQALNLERDLAYSSVSGFENLLWVTANTLSGIIDGTDAASDLEELESAAISPYIWYFDVKKVTSLSDVASLTPSISGETFAKNFKSYHPFAVNSFSGLQYNFNTGLGVNNTTPMTGTSAGPTGPGYYLFTYYVADLAGNACNGYISYYVKVDNLAPQGVVVDISVGNETDGFVKIDNSSNGNWFNKDVKTVLSWDLSFSGNQITFGLDQSYVVFIRKGTDGKYHIDKITQDGILVSADELSDDTYVCKVGDQTVFELKFTETSGKGNLEITFTGCDSEGTLLYDGELAYVVYNDGDNEETESGLFVKDSNWVYNGTNGSFALRIDKIAPDAAQITYGDKTVSEYFNAATGEILSVPDARIWYTSSEWSVTALLKMLSEDEVVLGNLTETDFANLHVKVWNYTDINEIATIKLSDLFAAAEGNLVNYTYTLGEILDRDVFIDLDPDDAKLAGLRVVVLQVEDAAGNVSASTAYTMLVDGNDYAIEAVLKEMVDLQLGDIGFVFRGEDGRVKTTFKRGEWSQLVIQGLAENLVPYEIYKDNYMGEQPFLMYKSTISPLSKEFYSEAIVEKNYVRVNSSDANIIELCIDRSDSIANLPFADQGKAQVTISFREVVTVAVTKTSVEYTGAETVPPVSISNLDAGKLIQMKFYKDGELVVDNEGKPVAPANVGEYELEVYLADSDTYVADEVKIKYSIIPGNIIITVHGTGVYGDDVSFTVDIVKPDGLVFASEGEFALVDKNLNVGKYAIKKTADYVLNDSDKNNYNITYILGDYTVTPRPLTITFDSAQKEYGAADPATYTFTVDGLGNLVLDSSIFGGATVADGKVSVSSAFVTRETNVNKYGNDNVGTYKFTGVDTVALGLNPNFTLSLAHEQGALEIAKRSITVRAIAGQVFNDANSKKVLFEIVSEDDKEFGRELVGKYLYIGSMISDGVYSVTYGDLVYLDNFNAELDNMTVVNVSVVTGDNVVVFDFTQLTALTVPFGTTFNTSVLTNASNYNRTNFGSGFKVTLKAEIVGYDTAAVDKFANGAGSYRIVMSVLSYVDPNNTDVKDSYNFVFTNCDYLTVTPAKVTVTPALVNNSKVYGDVDNWTFTYTYAGSIIDAGYAPAENAVGGKIVRALYRADGTFVQVGGQFDRVTTDGLVSTQGHYYGAYVLEPLYSNDGNVTFTLNETAFAALRFEITPKAINIDDATFLGKDKNFDGTSYVIFKGEEEKRSAINIAGQLAQITDDVWVDFVANYVDGAEQEASVAGTYSIRFHDFALKGAAAGNYVLEGSLTHLLSGSFTISGSGTVTIQITKNDFTISKEYDGTTALSIDDIEIAISSALCGLDVRLEAGSSFVSKNVGETISIGNMVLRIVGVNRSMFEDKSEDADIVYQADGNDTLIVVSNAYGTISKRMISLSEITLDIPYVKYYDGTNEIAVGVSLAGTVLQTGDDFASLGISFPATVPSKDVQGDKNNPTAQAVTFGEPVLTNTNYGFSFTAADINAAKKANVTIKPAVLSIDFSYDENDVVYDGSDEVSITVNGIKVEQGAIPEGEEIAIVNPSGVKFTYSDEKGNSYAYVQLDENGNVRLHDVKATGLEISASDNINANNYNIDLTVGGTVNVDSVFEALVPLNPIVLDINLSEIKIADKVYDGTNNAEIEDLNLTNYGALEADDIHFALDVVINNNNPNASDVKYDVKASNPRLTSGNAGVLASYTIEGLAGLTGTMYGAAKINPAPLAVAFNLAKTYDGYQYGNIVVTSSLTGFVSEAERSSYSVTTAVSAFNGADVAKDADTVIAKDGWVYGFNLVNTADKNIMNYYLVYASLNESNDKITDTGSLPAGNESGQALYYYAFTKEAYKVESSKLVTSGENAEKTPVQAVYKEGGTEYSVFNAAPTSTTEYKVINVADASGIVTPADIDYDVTVHDTTPFTKVFDDSAATSGWKYAAGGSDNTFDFDLKGQYGFVIGDVSVFYTSVNVGNAIGVTFRIDTFTVNGSDAAEFNPNNYNLLTSGTTINIGKITPAALDVALVTESEDGAVHFTYGDAHTYAYTYSFGGKEITLSKDTDGNIYGYILKIDYADAGFKSIVTQNRLYKKTVTGFEQSVEGQYVRLNGTFTEGMLPANEKDIVNAGEYTVTSLTPSATNFNYNVVNGKVVVDKAALEVGVNNTLSKEFGTNAYPNIDFKITGGALKLADTEKNIFALLNTGAIYRLATVTDGVTSYGEQVVYNSMISADLADNQFYALVLTGALANYNVSLDKDYKLEIVLPALTGISSIGTSFERPYDGTATTDANAFAQQYIKGLQSGDQVALSWGDGVIAKNAGSYNWTFTVTRVLGKDSTDTKEYTITATLGGEYTITPVNITVSTTQSLDFTYNGLGQTLDASKFIIEGALEADKEGVRNALVISYVRGQEVLDAMLNANAYTISYGFAEGTDYGVNYKVIDKIGLVTVKRATIDVTVDSDSRQWIVGSENIDDIAISFSVPEGFDKSDFTVTYESVNTGKVNKVTQAGTYSYTINYNNPNYSVRYGNGTMSVLVDQVSFVLGDTTLATVKFTDPVAVAYTLSYRELNNTSDEIGKAYWQFVDSYVKGNLGDSKNEAVTEGVLAVTLMNGANEVHRLNQQMTVTVSLPASMTSMDGYSAYYVNSDGQLVEITDYTLNGTEFSYTTDYISNLVFVKLMPVALPFWIWILVAILALLIILAIILAIVLSRKSKKKEFVPVTETAAPAPVAEPAEMEEAAADVEIIEYYDPNRPNVVGKNKKPPIIGIR